MIKSILIAIICLGVLFSVQIVFAEEELPLPEGKNIKEWESISAALVAEKRFSEAIIYLDKILEQEPDNLKALTNKAGLLAQLGNFSKSLSLSNKVLDIEPDRISALTNKAIALKMLGEYEKSYQIFTKILTIDPDNEKVKKSRAILLSGTPTISTNESEYLIHVMVTIRDENKNLVAVAESSNARYLPSQYTEMIWKKLDKDGRIKHLEGIEMYTETQKMNFLYEPPHYLGLITMDRNQSEHLISIFEVFLPMIEVADTETATAQWTIIKK